MRTLTLPIVSSEAPTQRQPSCVRRVASLGDPLTVGDTAGEGGDSDASERSRSVALGKRATPSVPRMEAGAEIRTWIARAPATPL